MVFHLTTSAHVPELNLLSWVFGGPEYDEDKDISCSCLFVWHGMIELKTNSEARSISTPWMTPVDLLPDKQRPWSDRWSVVLKLTELKMEIASLCTLSVMCVTSRLWSLTKRTQIMYSIIYLRIIGACGRVVGSNPGSTSRIDLFAQPHFNQIHPNGTFLFTQLTPSKCWLVCPISNSNIFVFDTPHDSSIPSGFQSWNKLLQYGEGSWKHFMDEKSSKRQSHRYSL